VTHLSAFHAEATKPLAIGAADHFVDLPRRVPDLSFHFCSFRVKGPLAPPVLHLQALPPICSVRPGRVPTLSFFFTYVHVRPPPPTFFHLESLPPVCAFPPGGA
jgi:hypothetical protein